MNANRHIWWSITAFTPDLELCQGTLPEFVYKLHGGPEKCPDTGRLHYQGAIQCHPNKPVRFATVKAWLPTAHIEPAKNAVALKQYVMKKETAVGDKVVRTNPVPHLNAKDMCILLASQPASQPGFWVRANLILRDSPDLAGQLMNPSLRNFYEKTEAVWIQWAASSITQPSTSTPCDCGRDECEACYEQEIAALGINGIPSPTPSSETDGQEEVYSPGPPAPRHRLHSDNPQGAVIIHQ